MFEQAGIEYLLLDYADSASIKAAVEQVLEKTGGHLYALFTNGAYGQSGACEDLSREAVLKRVVHALESKRPKIRYPVTFQTYLFAWLRRAISDRMLDRILGRVG